MESEQWKDNKTGKIYYSTDENMYLIDKDCYAIITVKKIDHVLLEQFEKQLKKGFAIHKFKSRGVRDLDKFFSEIKISKKPRLIAEKIRNENNKVLYNFNKLINKPHNKH
jgi:hypothetical protein